jgi:hypothetical protein
MQRLVRSPRDGQRPLFLALVVGMSLAGILEAFRRYAEATSTGEGSATTTYLLALVLGFPTNIGVNAIVENAHASFTAIPFLAYILFLLGVVVNALLIGAVVTKWRRRAPYTTPDAEAG